MGEKDVEELEKPIGPLVDRVLLRNGILRVDARTRRSILSAFVQALKDAIAKLRTASATRKATTRPNPKLCVSPNRTRCKPSCPTDAFEGAVSRVPHGSR